jgi:hypothetical protein
MSGLISVDVARREPFESLFLTEKILRDEINRRAWEVLKELDHEWYREDKIQVAMFKRGKVDIVEIKANVEHNHAPVTITAEMPLRQFEMLLQRDFSA